MFSGSDEENTAEHVAKKLSDHTEMKSHGRQIGITKAKGIGLKVSELEADKELERLTLAMHHAFMLTFTETPSFKIVENHKGVAMVYSAIPQPTR